MRRFVEILLKLCKAGFDSLEALDLASEEDLAAVVGVTMEDAIMIKGLL